MFSYDVNSSEFFDAASGLFDANTTRFFDSGVANADFLASGTYDFENVIDIGAKHTARITASLTQSARNPDDLFDNRSGNFDSGKSNFDGDTPANCDAHLEIATSDDNSTFSAVTSSLHVTDGSVDSNGIFLTLDANAETPQVTSIGYVGGKRYLRVVADFTGTHSNGTPIAATIIKGSPRHNTDADTLSTA